MEQSREEMEVLFVLLAERYTPRGRKGSFGLRWLDTAFLLFLVSP